MRTKRYATVLVVVWLIGCSQQATEKPVPEAGDGAPVVPEGVSHEVVIDANVSGGGKMTIRGDEGEQSFELKHVIAYRFEYQLAGPPTAISTWVLLTPEPINPAAIQAQLDTNQSDLMEAQPHFPEPPFLMLEIGKDGRLRQLSCYAEDYSTTWAGRAITQHGVEQQLAPKTGRVQGTVKLPPGQDDELTLDCQLDVLHFTQ